MFIPPDKPEFKPPPLPDPGPRPTYTTREDVLAALKRAQARGHDFFYEINGKDLAVGLGSPSWDEHPLGAEVDLASSREVWEDVLVRLDTLKALRDDDLVTSWQDDSAPAPGNTKQRTVKWYLGEWAFEGPGWVNGERQD